MTANAIFVLHVRLGFIYPKTTSGEVTENITVDKSDFSKLGYLHSRLQLVGHRT